tara:strand:+ start:16665 stop:17789 length:1125 start_codon:yes stop_codon:yes gene_type:complete
VANELLLVGSIAYDTAEEVFRSIAPRLGQSLPYIPDGETGERQYWVNHIAYRVLHGHPDIETVSRPMTAEGVECWHEPYDYGMWQFKIKKGVKQVRFGDHGRRLGYATDAISSYFIFKTLRNEGVIKQGTKFQVCLPLTASAVYRWLADKNDYPAIRDGFTEALYYEVKTIFNNIPHNDLAIQWDCAIEDTVIEEALEKAGGLTSEVQKLANDLFAPAKQVSSHIPDAVTIGYHACYGTSGGWPKREPDDLTGAVLLCNAAVKSSGRRVDFLHMPTVASKGSNYFTPLSKLDPQGARVYMGLIHALHGDGGMRDQISTIKTYIDDFGIAAPCGFGRGPGKMSSQDGLETANDYMEGLINDHITAVDLLHDVLNG